MMLVKRLLFLAFISSSQLIFCQSREYDIRTIVFYNLENLFDTINDPEKFDDDRTPTGKDRYTSKIYWDKINKLSRVLSEIGREKTGLLPVLIGVCEIENKAVLQDLVASEQLKDADYGIVHYDSSDERGIDVALLYQKRYFKVQGQQAHELVIYNEDGKRDHTRDQLAVSGFLDNEPIHIITNHWPSRRGGEIKSRPNRISAARLNLKIIDSIRGFDNSGKIITMGDFNDDPSSYSIQRVLNAKRSAVGLEKFFGLYNPMGKMEKRGLNTLAYRDQLSLFDQIIISEPLIGNDHRSYRFYQAGIYNKNYLITKNGPLKGYPFRSYHYHNYLGGFSDHFPVYIYLIKERG